MKELTYHLDFFVVYDVFFFLKSGQHGAIDLRNSIDLPQEFQEMQEKNKKNKIKLYFCP